MDESSVPPLELLEAHYGPGVSGVLRAGDFPSAPSSWFVQRQNATSTDATRWFTEAVYASRAAAEETVRRWEALDAGHSTLDPQTDEADPLEQAVFRYRVVSLLDLFREGSPVSLATMLFDLCMSDHEWSVSTELGSEAKIALYSAARRQ